MALTEIKTRKPELSDAAGTAAIDAEGLTTGHTTFCDMPEDWDSFTASFLVGRGLSLVAEDCDEIAVRAGVSPTSADAV